MRFLFLYVNLSSMVGQSKGLVAPDSIRFVPPPSDDFFPALAVPVRTRRSRERAGFSVTPLSLSSASNASLSSSFNSSTIYRIFFFFLGVFCEESRTSRFDR